MVNIRLTEKPNCITNLYDIVAKQLGYNPDFCRYNSTKITVSADVMRNIERNYSDPVDFNMRWLIFGPKMDPELGNNTVAIDDEFLIVEED